MIAAYSTVVIYIVAFVYQLLTAKTGIVEAAEKAVEVVMIFAPLLGAGAVIGLRKADRPIE